MKKKKSTQCPKFQPATGQPPDNGSDPDFIALQGSWHLQVQNRPLFDPLEGAVRISYDQELLLSADLYKDKADRLRVQNNWYPRFSRSTYRQYLRSNSFTRNGGDLTFNVEVLEWTNPFFSNQPDGVLKLNLVSPPGKPRRLEGSLTLDDHTEMQVVMTQTSILFRGGLLWIDNRLRGAIEMTWNCKNQPVSLTQVFQDHGIDLKIFIMNKKFYMKTFIKKLLREMGLDDLIPNWSMRVIMAGKNDEPNEADYGRMKDLDFPARQVAHVFTDPKLPGGETVLPQVRDMSLGQVPLALLRTTAHEIGHLFNLQHPDLNSDPVPPNGRLMYPTVDITNLSKTKAFPCCTPFAFSPAERLSLIHDPDPQVAPGWKPFGWHYLANKKNLSWPQATSALPPTVTQAPILHSESD